MIIRGGMVPVQGEIIKDEESNFRLALSNWNQGTWVLFQCNQNVCSSQLHGCWDASSHAYSVIITVYPGFTWDDYVNVLIVVIVQSL